VLFQPFPMLDGRAAQVWHHHPSFRRPRHFHLEPELNVVTRGHGVLSVGDRQFAVSRGDAVLLQAGQDHELLAESPDFELFVLALRPELAARCGALSARSLDVVRLGLPFLDELRGTWRGVAEVVEAGVVERILSEHFQRLLPEFALSPALPRRALLTLRERPELAESEIAQELRVHPSDISRSVRESFGVRLVDYRVRLRLMQFITDVDSGLSLSRAAYAAGFGSYTQCHRVFLKHLHCAPREYFERRRGQVDAQLHRDLATVNPGLVPLQ
jgi:AraC-like DNA-binding protein